MLASAPKNLDCFFKSFDHNIDGIILDNTGRSSRRRSKREYMPRWTSLSDVYASNREAGMSLQEETVCRGVQRTHHSLLQIGRAMFLARPPPGQWSESASDRVTPHLLPCRVHHSGSVEPMQAFWAPVQTPGGLTRLLRARSSPDVLGRWKERRLLPRTKTVRSDSKAPRRPSRSGMRKAPIEGGRTATTR